MIGDVIEFLISKECLNFLIFKLKTVMKNIAYNIVFLALVDYNI